MGSLPEKLLLKPGGLRTSSCRKLSGSNLSGSSRVSVFRRERKSVDVSMLHPESHAGKIIGFREGTLVRQAERGEPGYPLGVPIRGATFSTTKEIRLILRRDQRDIQISFSGIRIPELRAELDSGISKT